jgi:hypothetical protein
MGELTMNLKTILITGVCAVVVAAIIYGIIQTILAVDMTRL